MLNDTTNFLHCESEDYTLLYVAIIVMVTSSIAITSLMSFVVWIAKRRKQILQTPQRLWLRPLDLLMGNQVYFYKSESHLISSELPDNTTQHAQLILFGGAYACPLTPCSSPSRKGGRWFLTAMKFFWGKESATVLHHNQWGTSKANGQTSERVKWVWGQSRKCRQIR